MKKLIAMLLAVVMVFSLAACSKDKKEEVKQPETTQAVTPEAKQDTADVTTPAPTEAATPEVDIFAKSEGVMTYAEYAAAALDSKVVVETFVQAKQSWWDNKGTFYTQDNEGGYFLYSMPCTEEEYDKLVPGTKIKVTGYKSEWSGEVEITDAEYEIEEGTYIAEAEDLTAVLGTEALIEHQNEFVSFKGMTVAPQMDGSAFLYNWDGSGSHDSNSDLYFSLTKDGRNYSFTVESYLCYNTSEVYAAVENLKVGEIVDVEGFLYWYNGEQPHVTDIKVTAPAKAEGTMTYAEYAAAPLDSQVVVETFVQAKQSWWDNKGTFYTQDNEGGYFLYSMPCTEEEYNKLVPGTKIKVTGYKSEWSGEVEIVDATYEIMDGSYIANPEDVTDLLGTDELVEHQNKAICCLDMTVEAQADGSAFLYNWDGSGSHDSNSDLYFTLSKDGKSYSFTVESYLCDNTTNVYKDVEELQVGDTVSVKGFLYWYNGSQPHVTAIGKPME